MYARRHLLPKASYRLKVEKNKLTIIIPARDEAHRLPRLLASLQSQTIPHKIIVMDDGSSDQTAQIAKRYGAQVYETIEDTMGNWYGKAHACYQGAQHSDSEWLIFLDADVVLPYPEALASMITAYQQQGAEGLLSVQPYHQTERLYESLSATFNLMTVVGMNSFSKIESGQSNSVAFGPVLMTNSGDYFATEGHKNAQGSIIEGFALGRAYQRAGLPVELYEGNKLIHFRMYEEGFSSLVKGWTKHFSVGASQTNPKVMLAIVMWLTGLVISFAGVVLSLIFKPISKLKMGIIYLVYTYQFIRLHRRVGSFSILLLCLHPLLFVLFIVIFINSWKRSFVNQTVEWKGRQYHIE